VWNAAFGADGAANLNVDVQRSPITIANGVLYISERNHDTTYAFDAASGARLWSATLSDLGVVGPIVGDGHLYVGDLSGTIRAWTP
jgi:outer membrane protein assembly factor BamB